MENSVSIISFQKKIIKIDNLLNWWGFIPFNYVERNKMPQIYPKYWMCVGKDKESYKQFTGNTFLFALENQKCS